MRMPIERELPEGAVMRVYKPQTRIAVDTFVDPRDDVKAPEQLEGRVHVYVGQEVETEVTLAGGILEKRKFWPFQQPAGETDLSEVEGRLKVLEGRKPEQSECKCRALEFDQLKKAQDVLSQQVKTLLTTPRSPTPAMSRRDDQRVDQLITRNRELEETVKALMSRLDDLVERVDVLEGHNTETFEEFLRSERDGRDSDAETLESLREEIQMLMNRTQSADATQIEHDRYAELTCWESEILRG